MSLPASPGQGPGGGPGGKALQFVSFLSIKIGSSCHIFVFIRNSYTLYILVKFYLKSKFQEQKRIHKAIQFVRINAFVHSGLS